MSGRWRTLNCQRFLPKGIRESSLKEKMLQGTKQTTPPFPPVTTSPSPAFLPAPLSLPFEASPGTQCLTMSLLILAAAVSTNHTKVKTAFRTVLLLADY